MPLSHLQDRKRFDDPVAKGRKKIRPAFARGLKHVTRKLAIVRALLDEDEVVDLTESFPDFRELSGQQLTEDRTDAHICEIISAATDRAPARRIVSVLGMIKRLLHEPGEGLRAPRFDFGANKFDQSAIAGAHLVENR